MHSGLENKLTAELTYDQLVLAATNHFQQAPQLRNCSAAGETAGAGRGAVDQRERNDGPRWVCTAGIGHRCHRIHRKLVLEVGLEFWNYAYPYVMQRVRAREVIGPKISVVDANGNSSSQESHIDACCYAEKSLQLWEAFAEHFPQPQLNRVLTGQCTWFDLMARCLRTVAVARGRGAERSTTPTPSPPTPTGPTPRKCGTQGPRLSRRRNGTSRWASAWTY